MRKEALGIVSATALAWVLWYSPDGAGWSALDGFEKLEACRQQRLVHLSEFFPKNQVPPAPYVIKREKAKSGILSCLPDSIDPRRGR